MRRTARKTKPSFKLTTHQCSSNTGLIQPLVTTTSALTTQQCCTQPLTHARRSAKRGPIRSPTGVNATDQSGQPPTKQTKRPTNPGPSSDKKLTSKPPVPRLNAGLDAPFTATRIMDTSYAGTSSDESACQVPATAATTDEPPFQVSDQPPLDTAFMASSDEDEDEDLADVLQQHTADLMGGTAVPHSYPTFSAPISTPIASQISGQIKQRIWSNQFVDFALLLPSDDFPDPDNDQTFTLTMDRNAQLSVVPKKRPKRVISIESWTSAFIRFTSIYCMKYPHDTGAASKPSPGPIPAQPFHIMILNSESSGNPSCFPGTNYTLNFIFLPPASLLSLASRTPALPFGPISPFRKQSKTPRFQTDTCWRYNRKGCNLSNCPHPHVCGYCKGHHTANTCQSFRHRQPVHNGHHSIQTPSHTPTNTKPKN